MYQVMLFVDGKWVVGKDNLNTASMAKGIENQFKAGGFKTKVVKKKAS